MSYDPVNNPWGFGAPKEFGDRSDLGLGNLRALGNIPVRFLKSNPVPGTVVIKGNGFDTVTVTPPPPVTLGRYVSQGRVGSSTQAEVVLANGLRAPWRVKALSIVGGEQGSLTLGMQGTLVCASMDPTGNILISRSSDLATTTLEVSTFATPPTVATPFVSVTSHAAYNKDANGNINAYETTSFMRYDSTLNVMPKVVYSNAVHTWNYSSISGYNLYDHFAYFEAQLRPNLHMVAHAVLPRNTLWSIGGRANTPGGVVPYPLFQVSTDFGATYTPISMDPMFAGATYEYNVPRISGAGPAGYGGYLAIFGIQVQCLSDNTFFSMEFLVDSPSSVSRAVGALNYEARIWMVKALDWTTFTACSIPPGYGSVWQGALGAAFAETSPNAPDIVLGTPGTGFGAMGWMAFAVNQLVSPNMLMVTFDQCATWSVRPLPAIGRYCAQVQDISTRRLVCAVYQETSPPQIVQYWSEDYGNTWNAGQVVATNVPDLGTNGSIADFFNFLALNQDDGNIPTANPMAGWRYDSRIPRYDALAPTA